MPSISKFLFETSFDGPGGKPAVPAKPVKRNYTPAEVEAEKGKAFAEGHAAGIADAAKEIAARNTAAHEAIARRFAEMVTRLDQHHTESVQAAVASAVAMTRKLLPALSRSHAGAELETLIRDCLGRLHNEPKILIRLHDSQVESFRQRIEAMASDAGFSGRVVIVAEPRIAPEDARIEWADGGVERSTGQVWQEIEAIIERFVASGGQ
jgi:flagellar assembly protein FliH